MTTKTGVPPVCRHHKKRNLKEKAVISVEPDTFNSAVLNLLANVAKVSFLFYNTLFPRFWNHPQLRVGGGAEIWKGLPEEEEEGGLWSCKCEQTVSMATLDRFSLAAEPFAFGVLATDGLGL